MITPSILGLITARGGSKGIPGKNIKLLLSKPLIAYTIESAKASGVFDRIIISTDDPEIAKTARDYGAEVPFTRPAELSEDTTPHLPVVAHALTWLAENEGYSPEYVMILQPTSPTRQAFHIRDAAELITQGSKADSVISVAPIPKAYNSKKTMRLEGEYIRLLNGTPLYQRAARRQDTLEEYFSAGLIYLFKTSLVLTDVNPNFYGENTLPYVVDEKYLVDIDEPNDWILAEEKMKALNTKNLI